MHFLKQIIINDDNDTTIINNFAIENHLLSQSKSSMKEGTF